MSNVVTWNHTREMWIRILEKQTGQNLDDWKGRISSAKLEDEKALRGWLHAQGVSGYAESLLVMETFGYPDFMTASVDELLEGQYADRTHLRPIYDAIIAAAMEMGEITIQMRKSYVSLVTARRTFARVQPTTKNRVDLALRLEGQKPGGRLQPSKIHETMKLQISLTSVDEIDDEVLSWLRQAYDENR